MQGGGPGCPLGAEGCSLGAEGGELGIPQVDERGESCGHHRTHDQHRADADGVDDRVRAAAPGRLHDRLDRRPVHRGRSGGDGAGAPPLDRVECEYLSGAEGDRRPHRAETDRAQAEQDREVNFRTQAEAEFLARELASVRLSLADVATVDELRDAVGGLTEALARIESKLDG